MRTTKEQQDIIDEIIINNNNVIVNAVAGSGKTWTIIELAKQNPTKKILSLTYNNRLCYETKNKIKKLKIKNLSIYTYHSFASMISKKTINDDEKLEKFLKKNFFNKEEFDIVCCDEMQDCYKLLFIFIKKCFFNKNIKWLVIGDYKQSIYDFRGSDYRYLTMFDELINLNFVRKQLSINFRCNQGIIYFINNYLFNKEILKSNKKEFNNVDYFSLSNSFNVLYIAKYIENKIRFENYKESDFFILCPSLKVGINLNSNPIKKLENILVSYGFNVFFPTNDDYEFSEEDIENKIVFSTFHQSKGRERKNVIVFNFDNSYFKFYKKNYDPNVCPNELYVALTRAIDNLCLVEGGNIDNNIRSCLNFIDLNKLQNDEKINYFKENYKKNVDKKYESNVEEKVSIKETATNFVKWLNYDCVNEIYKLLEKIKKEIHKKDKELKIKNIYFNKEKNIYENVSNINSLALTSIYVDKNLNIKSIFNKDIFSNELDLLIEENDIDKDFVYRILNEKINKKNITEFTLASVNIWLSLTDKVFHKLVQIDKYNWLEKFNEYGLVYDRLNLIIDKTKPCAIEEEIFIDNKNIDYKEINIWLKNNISEYKSIEDFFISGRIDFVNGKNLFELKCTSDLNFEHFLQLVVYIFLNNLTNKINVDKYFLFNIYNNHYYEIKNDRKIIDEIIKIIIKNKYFKKSRKSDNDFINENNFF